MWYEGIFFNTDLIGQQTEEEFVNNPQHAGHWKQPGFSVPDKVRKQRLRELWRIIHASDKPQRSVGNYKAGANK